MAVVVVRSLPPAAHLHSLNSFVSKNTSPWSFRQFNIALDRSHLGKLSSLFLIWLHFSLSLIVQFAWNRQQVCYFDFLALQQRLIGFLVHERTVKQVVLEQQRTILICTGICGQIYHGSSKFTSLSVFVRVFLQALWAWLLPHRRPDRRNSCAQ